jgi:GxxExxY protein
MTQSNTEKDYPLITPKENWLGQQVVDVAVTIHKALGPGLLESVYEKVFCYELTKRNIPYLRQKRVDILYDELVVEDALRLDILVENLVVVELKAQENPHMVWEAQLLSYLKLTNKRLGYLINFHVPLMKSGIKRMVR